MKRLPTSAKEISDQLARQIRNIQAAEAYYFHTPASIAPLVHGFRDLIATKGLRS